MNSIGLKTLRQWNEWSIEDTAIKKTTSVYDIAIYKNELFAQRV